MKDREQIKYELNQLKTYYKVPFLFEKDTYILMSVKTYEIIINDAPLLLRAVYTYIYKMGYTLKATGEDLQISERMVKRYTTKIIDYIYDKQEEK